MVCILNNEIAVRAGIGTQLFQLLIGLAKYESKLSKIHHYSTYSDNRPGPYQMKPGAFESYWIKEVLSINFDIDVVLNSKQPHLAPHIGNENLNLVHSKLNDIIPLFSVNDLDNKSPIVIHNRRWDSCLVDEKIYQTIHNMYSNSIMVTDLDDDTIGDFLRVYHAKECIGAFSMFTMSAAVMNPALQLKIIPHSFWKPNVFGGISRMKSMINLTNSFINKFDNITWYEDEI